VKELKKIENEKTRKRENEIAKKCRQSQERGQALLSRFFPPLSIHRIRRGFRLPVRLSAFCTGRQVAKVQVPNKKEGVWGRKACLPQNKDE